MLCQLIVLLLEFLALLQQPIDDVWVVFVAHLCDELALRYHSVYVQVDGWREGWTVMFFCLSPTLFTLREHLLVPVFDGLLLQVTPMAHLRSITQLCQLFGLFCLYHLR